MGPALENAQVHFQTMSSSSFQGNPTTGKAGEWVTVDICVPQHLAQGLVHSWSRRGLASSERAGELNPKWKGETSKGGNGLKLNSPVGWIMSGQAVERKEGRTSLNCHSHLLWQHTGSEAVSTTRPSVTCLVLRSPHSPSPELSPSQRQTRAAF